MLYDPATNGYVPTQDWLQNAPKLSSYLTDLPPPQNQGNLFTSALSSGFHEALGNVGATAQAFGQVAGAPGIAGWGQRFAESQRQAATAAGRPDLEASPWSLKGIAYGLTKAVPTFAGAAAAAFAPELVGASGALAAGLGAGAFMFPQAAGANVQAAEQASGGQLDAHNAAKSLLLGAPEAALMAWAPKRAVDLIQHGVGDKLLKRIGIGAVNIAPYNALASGVQTAVTQQAFTPDMSAADRAKQIVDSVMQGGLQGAVFGGITGALSPKRDAPTPKLDVNQKTPNAGIKTQVDEALGLSNAPQNLPLPEGTPSPNIRSEDLGKVLYGPPPASPIQGIIDNYRVPQRPPEPPPALPPPRSEFVNITSENLLGLREALTSQASLTTPEAVNLMSINEELARRTQPGLELGHGNLFTPDQIAARAPVVAKFRDDVLNQVAEKNRDTFQKTDFFRNLNVTSEPELVNALQDFVSQFKSIKKTPDWVANLAEQYGIETPKTDGINTTLETLGSEKESVEKTREKALVAGSARAIRNADDRIAQLDTDIAKAQRIADLHAQANLLKQRAITTPEAAASLQNAKGDGTRILENPAVKARLDNVQIDAEHSVPYAAGANESNPFRVHIDYRIPQYSTIDGVQVDLHQALARHEIAEHEAMTTLDENYTTAHHDYGETAEKQYIQDIARENGKEPEQFYRQYSDVMEGMIKTAAEKTDVQTPPGLYTAPYHQENPRLEKRVVAEEGNAVREPSAAGVDVRQQTENGQTLGGTHGEGNAVTQEIAPGDDRSHYERFKRENPETAAALGSNLDPEPVSEEKRADDEQTRHAQLVVDALGMVPRSEREAQELLRQKTQDEQVHGRQAAEPIAVNEPGWAEAHAKGLPGGEVVHEDPNFSIIRTFSATGKPVYVATSRALGRFTLGDIRGQSIPDWAKGDQKRLAVIANEAAKDEVRKFLANRDGPFANSDRNVVASPEVSPLVRGYAEEILQLIGLGNMRVFLTHGDLRGEAGDANGLFGPFGRARQAGDRVTEFGHTAPFGENLKDQYIYLKPGMDAAKTIQVLAHEIGHIVQRVAFNNAPEEVRRAVIDAHRKWLQNTLGMSAQELVRSVRNSELQALNGDGSVPASRLTQYQYFTSFPEWFADHVSRTLTTERTPVGILGKFFAGVAQKMRQLMTAITGAKFLPDDAVRQFVKMMTDQTGAGFIGVRGDPFEKGARIPDDVIHPAETVNAADTRARSAADYADEIRARTAGIMDRLPVKIRKVALIGQTLDGLVKLQKGFLPETAQYRDIHDATNAFINSKAKALQEGFRAALDLPRKTYDFANKALVLLQNRAGVDPRKEWADHTELHNMPNSKELEDAHTRVKSEWDGLMQKNPGLRAAVENVLTVNQLHLLMRTAADLYKFGDVWSQEHNGTQLNGHGVNPDEIFNGRNDLHDSPQGAVEFYRGFANQMMQGIQDEITRVETLTGKKNAGDIADLRSVLSHTRDNMKLLERKTYSPLGRDGDFFVAGKLALDKNGVVDLAATNALLEALDKGGFENLGVVHDTHSNTVMANVKTMAQQESLHNLFKSLEAEGHMLAGETKSGSAYKPETLAGLGPKYLNKILASFKDILNRGDLDPKIRADLERQMVNQVIDSMPAGMLLPNTLRRNLVAGFDMDMVKTAAENTMNGARSTTYATRARVTADALQALRNGVDRAQMDQTISPAQKNIAADIYKEIMLRETQKSWRLPPDIWSRLQSWMHTLMIGANPAYVLVANSQIPTLLQPWLAKEYGYMGAWKAIARNTSPAIRALIGMLKGPDPWLVGLRKSILDSTTLSEKQKQVLLNEENRGGFASSAYTFGMTAFSEEGGGGLKKYHSAANAMGLYAEMLPRIIGALAAADLHEARYGEGKPNQRGQTVDQYVHEVVNGSQLNYGLGQNSRLTGPFSPFGPASRVIFGFTQYHTRLIETMVSEMHDLLSGKNYMNSRKEAGMFLAAHLAAITALAGTLGTPMTSFFAGALDKLANALTGRDDIDSIGLYRHWLKTTFGEGFGDVVAKGLPRAVGIDLSKLGEQNIIPFSGFMADKRKWEDALKDELKTMAGASTGEISNLVLGGRDILNGDYLQGLIKFAPEGIKGLAEGWYLTKHGYIDKQGNKLPFQPSTLDLILTLSGLEPQDISHYNEQKRIAQGLQAQRDYRSQNISRHLALAFQTGDQPALQSWMNEATKFSMQHPGMGGPLEGFGGNLQRQMTNALVARGMGVPIGVRPLDIGMRQATNF